MAVGTEDRVAQDDEAARRAAIDASVRWLGRREHSRRELERKLRARGHCSVLVAEVLDYLGTHDLQSDSRFVESYVRARTQKGYGPLKIRQELASRGIDEADLEPALTASAEFWLDLARAALVKRFGARGGRDADEEEGVDRRRDDWNAQARFLARRGFPSDLIFRVLGPCRD